MLAGHCLCLYWHTNLYYTGSFDISAHLFLEEVVGWRSPPCLKSAPSLQRLDHLVSDMLHARLLCCSHWLVPSDLRGASSRWIHLHHPQLISDYVSTMDKQIHRRTCAENQMKISTQNMTIRFVLQTKICLVLLSRTWAKWFEGLIWFMLI